MTEEQQRPTGGKNDAVYDEKFLSGMPEGKEEIVRGQDGSEIHCVSSGKGPTVVLAHGYLLDMTVFNIVYKKLIDAGYRVIAFDQRGHGRSKAGTAGLSATSAASDYAAVLKHFEVEDSILVAHSMGVFLTIVFCLNHKEVAEKHLRRLVLVSGNAGAVAKGSWQNRLQIPLLKTGLITLLWRMPYVGTALVSGIFGPKADKRFIEFTRLSLLRQDTSLTLPLLRAMLNEDYYSRLGEISIETRVLCGDADHTCPRWHSEKLGSDIPNATNTWIPGAGHPINYEAPDAIVEAVKN